MADEISAFSNHNHTIFKYLSFNNLKTLYLNGDICDYRKFQNVYREKDKADHFYLIKSGEFEVLFIIDLDFTYFEFFIDN